MQKTVEAVGSRRFLHPYSVVHSLRGSSDDLHYIDRANLHEERLTG